MKQVTRKRINRVIVFTITGAILGLVAGYISTLLDREGNLKTLSISMLGSVLGLILGFQFGVLEEFIWRPLSKKVNFAVFSTIQFFSYLVLIILWLIITISLEHIINDDMSFIEGVELYIQEEDFFRDTVFAFFMTMLLIIIGKLRLLHNGRQLFSLFTGKYYYPEREIRTIMFIDTVGSTSIAEQLGAQKYSSFLQSYFSHLSESLIAWGGEVYQYLGDGIVVSWLDTSGINATNSISCFFDMVKILHRKRDYYISRFGIEPQFRAGIHKGEIIINWVGEGRKELAFHGDTINTAARIESLCKEYNKSCLVSEELLKGANLPDKFKLEKIGTVTPRGKSSGIKLFSVTEVFPSQ